ncbi:MAG: hypothetical protein LBU68_02620 [Rickettsiales bacterium]|nr:hypothetical protein [Rickettsiales bacterium]
MVLSKIKKIARVFMALYTVAIIAMGTVSIVDAFVAPAYAQNLTVQETGNVNTLGPFQRVGQLLVGVFINVRNLVYIACGFVILWLAYDWIKKPGDLEWKNVIGIVVCLALMATVGYFIESVTGQTAGGNDSFVPGSTIQVN